MTSSLINCQKQIGKSSIGGGRGAYWRGASSSEEADEDMYLADGQPCEAALEMFLSPTTMYVCGVKGYEKTRTQQISTN